MGYREYLYEVDKGLVEKIRACKTHKEYLNLCKEYFPDEYSIYGDSVDGEEGYFPIYRLGKELFEFGKYYENSNEMHKHGDSLFASQELRERYEDDGAIVIDESGLLCAIEWQRNRILSIYQDLEREKSENKYDDRSQYERLQAHMHDHLLWWGMGCCDLDKDIDSLVSSWLYEHTIFDLVRIYKTFDWENNCMLFAGW